MTGPVHPVLYSFRRCPYAMRARMALVVSGTRCELREVVLKDKPDQLLALSPKATVPVLWLPDGTVLEQSLDILFWALNHSDPEGWMDCDRAEAEALVAINDGPFKHHLDRTKYANRYEGAESETHRSAALGLLEPLQQRLAVSPFLFGDTLTWADVAIAPFVRQFAHIDKKRFEQTASSGLQDWLGRFLASERFVTIMKKTPQWVPEGAPKWLHSDL